jgi:hypothetical protein
MRSFASLYIYLALKVYILTINVRAMFVLIASHMSKSYTFGKWEKLPVKHFLQFFR